MARARHEGEAGVLEQLGLAADQRVQAAEHRATAHDLHEAVEAAEQETVRSAEITEREARAREGEDRIRRRVELRRARGRAGLHRLRPGPSISLSAPWIGGEPSPRRVEEALDREIDVLSRALSEHGATERPELARLVGARYWGPGQFGAALGAALEDGRVRRLSRRLYGPAEHDEPEG